LKRIPRFPRDIKSSDRGDSEMEGRSDVDSDSRVKPGMVADSWDSGSINWPGEQKLTGVGPVRGKNSRFRQVANDSGGSSEIVDGEMPKDLG
jgi:hypothetical protein